MIKKNSKYVSGKRKMTKKFQLSIFLKMFYKSEISHNTIKRFVLTRSTKKILGQKIHIGPKVSISARPLL